MKKLATAALVGALTLPAFAAEFITIGTGGVTGTYYPTGGAICRLVNQYKKETKIRCSVESTGGSVYNVNTIKNGELDFGIVQSDVVYQASKGTGRYQGDAVKKLKSVMAIYPELLTLVSRKDANINSLADVKGKRINLGNPGSGNEATALNLFKVSGIKKSDLAFAGALKASEMPDALRDNKIDGYFYMVGHPTANIKDASNSVDVKIVPLEGNNVDKLIKENPYFAKADVPGGIYKGNPDGTPTFGVKAVLVTSDDVSEKAVYTVVKAILENFEKFKKLHPAYANITKKSLLDGLSAPLHEGAKKYFKEAGILQ
ncbi:TRAP transporter, substrate binding protein, TAXI family [Malaciobacter marinus]|uniref:C4-dicarboxylate ABC transporter substrate-binding protein n=1 Tax=Malaciobacter marinus TaxID=505249 RepID=A0A347TP02_9BACT|nr:MULTISPECIES: TAXI family TRAP transporter solute-binding subunit [Malaciobacter]AXX88330.1 TRAP transporter, substrate binding protein, TAXI family [Malaciobacter marinus]PHO13364.1 C4-dicarboxylate ABC transporter substrate-binding protein [Malaciobacter marinus]PHO15654.1 C4-dicarboxylate ABC transporter substrate-binding protein [Malaciobacter marinus]RYA24583.1 C4-dicarboxylate ABC transporter substrate-binding protein [Malaciobacter halophilus]